ncbi:putative isomerase [Cellulomonas chitinilytica]|uniref:Isomerase n=1 Tax=Cellulomonas chitinilytica TaxID=398759 RepID=A0A919P436_9CELL|nr:PhzF family phenazine biosynthesis protein [Cellulomonas chitinilytica]GIG21797.1 putative isomerase [Cellulomonas chitinilytica]
MRIPLFQLDSFTTTRFAGNPAAVMPVGSFPADDVMRALAAENNLSETAFLVPDGDGYLMRWFTPTVEVPLCGHATLASAAVVMERLEPGRQSVVFRTASGPLTVRRTDGGYVMDFPAHRSTRVEEPPGLADALGAAPVEVWRNASNLLAVFEDASTVRAMVPDHGAVRRLTPGTTGLVVTAPGDEGYDFVSRYFAPAKGIPEDPVTGGAHCTLTPYWATRTGGTRFSAYQASARGGSLTCTLVGERVELEGAVVFYSEGHAEV